jgi:enamine deaminase RidA (YjgF/YER057c/UK114 family)
METQNNLLRTVHHEDYDKSVFSPYVPAIVAMGGSLVFMSGVTAAPVYHDHPHVPEVFDAIPLDIEGQVKLTFEHIELGLKAAGCERHHVVAINRYFTDVAADQDVVNAHQHEWFGDHLPTHTTVEVSRLAPDPRLRLELQVFAVRP